MLEGYSWVNENRVTHFYFGVLLFLVTKKLNDKGYIGRLQ